MRLLVAMVIGGIGLVPARVEALESEPTAATPGQEPHLVVRVDPEFPQGDAIVGWIEQRGQEVLGKRAEPLESVDQIQIDVEGSPYDYRIRIEVSRRQQLLEEQPEPLLCECGSDEMLDRVGAAIDAAADQLAELAAVERMDRVNTREVQRYQEENRRREDGRGSRTRGRYQPGPPGWAGIGAMSLGGIVSAGGAVMLTQALMGDEGMDSAELFTPGVAVLGVGSAMVLGGLIALSVDVARCKKDEGRCVRRRSRAALHRGGTTWSWSGGNG